MKLNFQRDWRECSNPQTRFQVQNQSIESRLKKIERNNKFRSYPRKRVSLKRMRKKRKRKRLPTEAATSTCTRTLCPRIYPSGLAEGETMTILLHSDAGLLAGETMAPADMQPAKTDMSVQRTRRLAWDFVFSSLRQATRPARGSNFSRAGCTFPRLGENLLARCH